MITFIYLVKIAQFVIYMKLLLVLVVLFNCNQLSRAFMSEDIFDYIDS